MKKDKMDTKTSVIILSVFITVVFVFFSIPSFIQKDKIEQLVRRLESYQAYQPDSPGGNTVKPNQKPSSNSGKPNPNSGSSGSSNSSSTDFDKTDSDKDSSDKVDSNENDLENENRPNSNEDSKEKEQEDPKNEEEKTETPAPPTETKGFTATFIENGAALGEEDKIQTCFTTEDTCSILLPNILSSDKTIIGWGNNPNDVTALYRPGERVSIGKDETFYALTKKNINVTIYGNGAFRDTKYLSCSTYNTSSSCSITLPDLEDDFYTTRGYAQTSSADTILYRENETILVDHSFSLYAVRFIDPAPYYKYSQVTQEMFQKINILRSSKGVPTLSWSKSLELSAMVRAHEISLNYDFEMNGDHHYRISNNEPFYSVNTLARGENFYAEYYSCDANYFHEGFVNSPGHYENMVRSSYQSVGIAITYVEDSCYIVELFG